MDSLTAPTILLDNEKSGGWYPLTTQTTKTPNKNGTYKFICWFRTEAKFDELAIRINADAIRYATGGRVTLMTND